MKRLGGLLLLVLLVIGSSGPALAFISGQKKDKNKSKQSHIRSEKKNGGGLGGIFKKAGSGLARGVGGFAVNIVRGKPIVAGRKIGQGAGVFGKQVGKGVARLGKKVSGARKGRRV